MTVHQFITSSDFEFGDMMLNFCDPEFADLNSNRERQVTNQIYRIISYSLFASRLIIPSRYLLQPSITYDSLVILSSLLEGGIIVPDLREGYCSFVDFIKERGSDNEKMLCAKFLDDHAEIVYSFDAGNQSSLYHQHLLDDIAPHGLLRRQIDPEGCLDREFDRAHAVFAEEKGSRRTFVNTLTSQIDGYDSEIKEWAALRYYATPAELEPRCFRDFPPSVSAGLRDHGLSRSSFFTDPTISGDMPEPMNSVHKVLVSLPDTLNEDDLTVLVDLSMRIRDEIPNGTAKFSQLSERGFQDSVIEVNQIFHDALQREQRFSSYLRSIIPSFIIGHVPSLLFWWSFGVSLDPVTNVAFDAGIQGVMQLVTSEIHRLAFPFVETAIRLQTRVNKAALRNTSESI